MRWLYLTVVVLFVAATILFALQNVEPVTMSFLEFGIRAPLAVLAAVVYVLGAVAGGSVFALLIGGPKLGCKTTTPHATKARLIISTTPSRLAH